MSIYTLHPDLPTFWRTLHRRMNQARWSAATLVISTLLFLIFLEELWRHPYERIWSISLGALTLHLLFAQWRLAGTRCPRCGGSWTERMWRLPNPFSPYHPRCSQCGFSEKDQL